MIRSDILNALEAQDQQQSLHALRDRTLALVEELQNSLTSDPSLAGWTPIGPDGQSTLSDILPEDLATLRRESTRAFYRSAHGRNVIRTMVKFIIGQGTVIDFHEKDEETLEKITTWWRKFMKVNKGFSLQREIVTRSFRDGECFLRRFPTATGPLLLRFIDPDRIGSAEVPDGIETDPDDVETVIQYHISRGGGAKAEKVPAADILHIKLNVDRNVKRGRPLLEPILPFLTKYAKWLDARMVLNIIRASVALVQEVTGSNTDLLRLRSAQRTTKSSPQETDKSKMLRPGTIIRGTPGVKYSMLSPNLDAKDAAEDGRTILLAIAAAAGLPDTFVTADWQHSNFASSIVAQNPAIREFEDQENVFIEYFSQIVEWVLEDGVEKEQIPLAVNDEDGRRPTNLDFDITFPPLLRRDLNQEVQAYATMHDSRVVSKRTWGLRMGLDPDVEQHLLAQEVEDDPPDEDDLGQQKRQDAKRKRTPNPKRPGDREPRQQTTGEEGHREGHLNGGAGVGTQSEV